LTIALRVWLIKILQNITLLLVGSCKSIDHYNIIVAKKESIVSDIKGIVLTKFSNCKYLTHKIDGHMYLFIYYILPNRLFNFSLRIFLKKENYKINY